MTVKYIQNLCSIMTMSNFCYIKLHLECPLLVLSKIKQRNTLSPKTYSSIYIIYSRAILMKTQHPNVQYINDILNILSHRISGDFMNTKDRRYIGFIGFNVKCLNVYTHAHFPTVVFTVNICRNSLAAIPKIMNYWLCGTNFQVFLLRFSE